MSVITEAINYLFHTRKIIKVPTDFHSRVKLCKRMLSNDFSGLVTANIDFAISVSSVDYKFETGSKKLTQELNKWKKNINSGFEGRIPSGLRELEKEYLKERWTSSLIVMNVKGWEKTESGLLLPTKIYFMDGGGITVKGDDTILGGFKYLIKTKKGDRVLPLNKKSNIFVRKPFDRWYNKYPSPFLVRRGTLASWLMKKILKEKSTEILDEMVAHLLMIKKGTERLFMEGNVNYGDKELGDMMGRLKKHLKKKRETSSSGYEGNLGAWAVPFDTELEEFIPDLQKIFSRAIYEEIDRDILSSLGFIEIVEGIQSTRREAVLNPKPFIREIYSAINDFANLMEDLVKIIVEKNIEDHRKWFSENTEIKVKPGTPHIGLSALLIHFRSLYDRGLLSRQTYLDIVEQDIDTEKERKSKESRDGFDEIFYPPIIMNREEQPYIPDFPEKIEDQKPEKKKSEGGSDRQEVKCRECQEIFTLDANVDLETTGCPYCTSEYLDLITAPYTKTNYPSQIKNLPAGARAIWIETYNSVYAKTKDTDAARMAAWRNVKLKYKKVGEEWVKRTPQAGLET